MGVRRRRLASAHARPTPKKGKHAKDNRASRCGRRPGRHVGRRPRRARRRCGLRRQHEGDEAIVITADKAGKKLRSAVIAWKADCGDQSYFGRVVGQGDGEARRASSPTLSDLGHVAEWTSAVLRRNSRRRSAATIRSRRSRSARRDLAAKSASGTLSRGRRGHGQRDRQRGLRGARRVACVGPRRALPAACTAARRRRISRSWRGSTPSASASRMCWWAGSRAAASPPVRSTSART